MAAFMIVEVPGTLLRRVVRGARVIEVIEDADVEAADEQACQRVWDLMRASRGLCHAPTYFCRQI